MTAFVQCKERVLAQRVQRTAVQTWQKQPVARRLYERNTPRFLAERVTALLQVSGLDAGPRKKLTDDRARDDGQVEPQRPLLNIMQIVIEALDG